MKKHLFTILILFLPILATCQDGDRTTDSLTNERLKKTERILAKLPKISGIVNFRYDYTGEVSTFDLSRARIDLRGDLSSVFDYGLQFELAGSKVLLLDAYLRAKIKPWLHIQVGEFKIPLTMENPYSPLNLEFIDNAMSTIYLCSYNDLSRIKSSGRDIGVMVSGSLFKNYDFYIFKYEIGVFNGSGINIEDDNKAKDLIGRISFNPIKDLTISASGQLGKFETSVYNIDQEITYYTANRNRLSAGIRYDDGKIVARGEYVYGNTNSVKSEGFYVLAGYTFFEKLMPAIRYDYFRLNTDRESFLSNYTIGVNYWATKFLRCQLNYTLETFSINDDLHLKDKISALITFAF